MKHLFEKSSAVCRFRENTLTERGHVHEICNPIAPIPQYLHRCLISFTYYTPSALCRIQVIATFGKYVTFFPLAFSLFVYKESCHRGAAAQCAAAKPPENEMHK